MNGDYHPVGSPLAESGRVELLPCPFCGGDANAYVSAGDAVVECIDCGAELSQGADDEDYHDTSAIVARWNRRAPDRALLDRIEELEGALRDADAELLEAADKFNVIHHNHPGKAVSKYQEQDKQFCASLSDRMMAAHSRARKALSGEKKP
jgi:uncharacterized Zn finger protein